MIVWKSNTKEGTMDDEIFLDLDLDEEEDRKKKSSEKDSGYFTWDQADVLL